MAADGAPAAARIRIMDLPWRDAERVEQLSGIPMDDWMTGNKVRLLVAVLAVHEGRSVDDYDLSLGELLERVSMGDAPGEADAGPE